MTVRTDCAGTVILPVLAFNDGLKLAVKSLRLTANINRLFHRLKMPACKFARTANPFFFLFFFLHLIIRLLLILFAERHLFQNIYFVLKHKC